MHIRLFLMTFLSCLLLAFTAQAQDRYAYDPFAEEPEKSEPAFKLGAVQVQDSLPQMPLQQASVQPKLEIDKKSEPSRIEAYYSNRIVDELSQFGYELFSRSEKTYDAGLPTGAVQDNFILSIGDKVTVTLRGQINSQKTYQITSDGLLTLDNLPPVPAAGRSMAQIQAALKSQMSSMPNIDLYMSLDKVRQIGVIVIGHVEKPGRQTLTVFHSLLDALNNAGGITKDGSLRTIKLVRDGRTEIIDLYSLLIHASDLADVTLKDGDRLIIPSLGPTLAVAGSVKRPGIYELRKTLNGMNHDASNNSETLNLQEVLGLAGGLLAPGQNRFMHLSLTQNGYEDVIDVSQAFKPQFHNGSILMVSPTNETRQGQIEISGHSRKNGLHPLSRNKTLSAILKPETLGSEIYPLIGVIERYDAKNLKKTFLPFPLHLVIKDQFDQRLQDADVIHLFSKTQIHNLKEDITPKAIIPASLQTDQGSLNENLRQESYVTDTVIADILREHSVHLKGSVRLPGAYPVTDGATLEDILAISGGLTLEANRNRIEVTSNQFGENGQDYGRSGTQRMLVNLTTSTADSVALVPGDTVRVNQTIRKLKNDTVLLSGEVVQPGEYNLMPGDRLSTLLARAGGLTPEAYPDGTIFSREQERRAEEQRYRITATEIERSLATAMNREENKPNTTQVAMVRGLAEELRNAKTVGRITVEASPDKLLSYPELDILLETGDRIYIPKRPYNVRVRGEVLSPSNLQFRSGKAPRDYLMEAGGFTHFADKDRTFVIYPDGSAQPLQVSNWNYKPVMIPPGSTIIVPRDPKPFDFMETAKDISQIFGNLAITAVVIDDIQDD